METTWTIIGQDGQFLVVKYARGESVIILQVLPPTPREDQTYEEALADTMRAHEPSPAQFERLEHDDLSDLIGQSGSTSKVETLPVSE